MNIETCAVFGIELKMYNLWTLITGLVLAAGMALPSDANGINMTEYYKMPPLYLMDDYDRCLEEGTAKVKTTYCYTRTQIKPNDTSPLWKIIEEFSANHKRHFRHDRLNRGICLHWCKPFFHDFVSSAKRRYIQEKFDNETDITFDPNSLTRGLDDRIKYNKLINMCVNKELRLRYNLMAYSTVEYCITNHDTHETDSLDWWFFWIFVGLIKILISSTLYDFFLRRRNFEHNNCKHYQHPVEGKYAPIMVSFSLPRNWYRLMAKSSSQIARDLRPIHAIRFMTMFCVMLGHAALFMNILPTANPQYMEKNYYRIVTQLMINGATVIQTFFAISGYLLSVQFMQLRKSHDFSLHFFWKTIIYRYIRLTPVYMFLLFFNVTWLIRVQEGPMWPHITDTERTFCRKNWWTNLLYVNNIFGVSEPCFQHGWYLAADFQMFIVGVAMHLIFWKFPKSTKILLSLGILVSYVVPGIVTYTNQFEGAFMATPENQRYAHWYDKMYASIYIPAYTNFGSFLCGMIGGILYYKYRQQDNYNRPRGFKVLIVLWYISLPIAVSLLLSGFIFYQYDFNKPAFWIAFYSSGLKNLWGVYGAVYITGMAFGIGWIFRKAMCHPVFRTLGRLTYCAFLVHPAIIRISLGNQRQPVYSSDMQLVTITMSLFLQSYIVAVVLCICMELPIASLQRYFSDKEFDTVENTKMKKDIVLEMIRPIHNE